MLGTFCRMWWLLEWYRGGNAELNPHRASLVAQLIDKESTCNAGDPDSIPGSGSSPGKGIGYPHRTCSRGGFAFVLKGNRSDGRVEEQR